MRAKIFRVSGYIVEYDRLNFSEKEDVERLMFEGWYNFVPQQVHIEESEEFELEDENLKVLKDNCDMAILEKHFERAENSTAYGREVVIGGTYKHFKKGKLVKVLAVSRHSERPNEITVVYECSNGVFNRPIDMFLSEVDHEKYPDAKQKYRFELVEVEE